MSGDQEWKDQRSVLYANAISSHQERKGGEMSGKKEKNKKEER